MFNNDLKEIILSKISSLVSIRRRRSIRRRSIRREAQEEITIKEFMYVPVAPIH
jgi:hypothetical protein